MGDSNNAAARIAACSPQCSCARRSAFAMPSDGSRRDLIRGEYNRIHDELRAIKRELSAMRDERDVARRRVERLEREVQS